MTSCDDGVFRLASRLAGSNEVLRHNVDVYRRRAEVKLPGFRELTDAKADEPLGRPAKRYPLDRTPEG